jgi:hypothetical protein
VAHAATIAAAPARVNLDRSLKHVDPTINRRAGRSTMDRVRTLVAILLLAATAPVALAAADEPEPWQRVRHPSLPIWFDVPPGTTHQRAAVFSLASPWLDARGRPDFSLFGVRAVSEGGHAYKALELAFVWLTDALAGVEAEALAELPGRMGDRAAVEELLRGALYAGRDVELRDLGRDLVGARPARRFAVEVTIARGTRDERRIDGECAVIPVSDSAALVVVARFDPAATEDERERTFPRILRSVRIGDDEEEPPLDVRLPRSEPLDASERAQRLEQPERELAAPLALRHRPGVGVRALPAPVGGPRAVGRLLRDLVVEVSRDVGREVARQRRVG